MQSPQKPQSLKKLQAEWYKKLKNEGFVDIEQDEDTLKTWASSDFTEKTRQASTLYSQRAEYYYMANHFLNKYAFEDDKERIVWEYHSNGISIRNIAKILTKNGLKASRDTIWRTIKTLKKEMLLGIYKCRPDYE